jgi:putative membrane protein
MKKDRKVFPDYFTVTLKGMAMGAADVVPGVSGGTIAFISGIYQELIDSINSVSLSFFKVWQKEGFKTAWTQINGSFLISLLLGIAISILSLAKIITYLLKNEAIAVWSFFFGLVVASIFYIGKQVKKWSITSIVALLVATFISYYITIAEPFASPESNLYLFLSGFIAIIAMILPGVSGAFILLLMGSYEVIMGTINQFRDGLIGGNMTLLGNALLKIFIFGIGAILGLKLFSKILHWMFEKHNFLTLSILTGFMIGSLNKVWPWKLVLETRINSHGETVPFLEKSILPNQYLGEPTLFLAIGLMIAGFLTILILEKAAAKFAN